MFCKNCGNNIEGNACFCPHCGVAVENDGLNGAAGNYNYPAPPYFEVGNVLAIAGFVLSFIFAIAGLICSILGYRKCVNEGAPYRGFAVAGIIISALEIGAVVIIFITFVIVANFIVLI